MAGVYSLCLPHTRGRRVMGEPISMHWLQDILFLVLAVGLAWPAGSIDLGSDRDPALPFNGLHTVQNQVQKDLVKLF